MKALSLLAAALLSSSAFAAETPFQLSQDTLVDGQVDSATAQHLSLPLQVQNQGFAHTDATTVLKGNYLHDKALIQFDINTDGNTAYYLGKQVQGTQYKGNWYDSLGNAGDFNLTAGDDDQNGGDCNAATETGWFNGYYCNAEIEGGGWQLVMVRSNSSSEPRTPVPQITDIVSNQYMAPEQWAPLKARVSEILFLQPSIGMWGIMTMANATNPDYCQPLDDDLSSNFIVHAENVGCNKAGGDYSIVGHETALPQYRNALWAQATKYPDFWALKNFGRGQHSDALMMFVR